MDFTLSLINNKYMCDVQNYISYKHDVIIFPKEFLLFMDYKKTPNRINIFMDGHNDFTTLNHKKCFLSWKNSEDLNFYFIYDNKKFIFDEFTSSILSCASRPNHFLTESSDDKNTMGFFWVLIKNMDEET